MRAAAWFLRERGCGVYGKSAAEDAARGRKRGAGRGRWCRQWVGAAEDSVDRGKVLFALTNMPDLSSVTVENSFFENITVVKNRYSLIRIFLDFTRNRNSAVYVRNYHFPN